jgi:hypothetical protein
VRQVRAFRPRQVTLLVETPFQLEHLRTVNTKRRIIYLRTQYGGVLTSCPPPTAVIGIFKIYQLPSHVNIYTITIYSL